MASQQTLPPWARSLKTRILVLLTIALVPLGVIAVLQTRSVVQDAMALSARDILSRTERAASRQEAVIRRAYGAASGLGSMAVDIGPDDPACSAAMQRFIAGNPDFVFAGFIAADGMMTCSSNGAVIDYSDRADWRAFVAEPQDSVSMTLAGDASGESAVVVFVPIFDPATDALLGGQAISEPHQLTQVFLNDGLENVALALIDTEGNIVASSLGMDNLSFFERLDIIPQALSIPPQGTLTQRTSDQGERQPVAVVPLIADELYVVGLWTEIEAPTAISFLGTTAPVFPILMWLTSLAVAFLAVNRLILRPLSHLSGTMRDFRADGGNGHFATTEDMPLEIRNIAESYNAMVDRVLSDHDKLETGLREKELLLREVHHRVKNNLQLISSIVNMQMRGIKQPDAKRILSRVQDRILSLATVHRSLYAGDNFETVRADALLNEVVGGVLDMGIAETREVRATVSLAPVSLDPDQAVPLSLLATEAVTNATKYVGRPATGTPEIKVALQEDEDGVVRFDVTNSRGAPLGDAPAEEGSRLGSRLIQAFASQIGGTCEAIETEDAFRLQVAFRRFETERPAAEAPA